MRRLRRLAALITVGVPIFGYTALAVLKPCGFAYFSVCTQCGMIEQTDERHLPLVDIKIGTRHSLQQSPFSATLARHGVRTGHIHEWEFGQGGDYGLNRSCAIGDGRFLYGVAYNTTVANFVDALCLYSDRAEREKWIDRLLDARKCYWAARAIKFASPPRNGFPDAASFHKWWDQNSNGIEENLQLFSP
jgi:hypothetical protein